MNPEAFKNRKDEHKYQEQVNDYLKNQKGSGLAALLFFSIPVLGYFLVKNSWFPVWFKIPLYAINFLVTVWIIGSILNGQCI